MLCLAVSLSVCVSWGGDSQQGATTHTPRDTAHRRAHSNEHDPRLGSRLGTYMEPKSWVGSNLKYDPKSWVRSDPVPKVQE